MAMKKGVKLLYTTAIVVLILDIITKTLVRTMPENSSINLLPFFSISHIENLGIAFGFLQLEFMRWILVAIALAVTIAIIWSCKERKLKEHFLAWGLIAGGALGNALDRIFIGTVTDFINFHVWPAFNIADSALTIGVIILIYHSFKKE